MARRRGGWLRRWQAWRILRRARDARGLRDYAAAADLYGAFLRVHPDRTDLLVQRGHMLKEAGALPEAEQAYRSAHRRTPDDPDLAVQLGHFHKVAGEPEKAAEWFARAIALDPGSVVANEELAALRRAGFPPPGETRAADPPPAFAPIPDLLPRKGWAPFEREGIYLRRLGREAFLGDGLPSIVRGVDAVRGVCAFRSPIDRIELLLNGIQIKRETPEGPFPAFAQDQSALLKYSFNLWHDFSAVEIGRHGIEVRAVGADGRTHSVHRDVAIRADRPNRLESNADIPPLPDDGRSIEARIADLPSLVHPAGRTLLADARNILVLRTDQLGDVVASLPAMRRLREIFPHARIVGLLTAANADLARTLGLFDEIITIDFPDVWEQRRRIMPAAAQEALADRLAPYRFDLALDLATSSVSRHLLRLAGARMTLGAGEGAFGWLTFGFDFNSHDPGNRMDIMSHSAKVLAMVEALGAAVAQHREIVRREDLGRDRLARFDIGPDDRYAVLHAGARIAFSRWPHYRRLAALILERTDLKVVLMGEEGATPSDDPRLIVIAEALPFDDFDAILSHAAVMVGNDSGPKHLAALRGVEVVTLFTARINWQEWGQETTGVVISRAVPCAGCAIFHDEEECGKDFICIRGIDPVEVLQAVLDRLNE